MFTLQSALNIFLLRWISDELAMNMDNTEIIVFRQASVGLAMNLDKTDIIVFQKTLCVQQ